MTLARLNYMALCTYIYSWEIDKALGLMKGALIQYQTHAQRHTYASGDEYCPESIVCRTRYQ